MKTAIVASATLAMSVLGVSCSHLFTQEEQVDVIVAGTSPYSLVCAATATEVEKNAAWELANHLKQVAGVSLPIKEEGDALNGPAIYVGQTAFAQAHGISFRDFSQEEWLIKTVGKDIVIGGGRPRGTLYGALEFLERHAGVMWLDERFTFIPKAKRLAVPENLELRGKPAFAVRGIYAYFKDEPEKRIHFMARNRQNLFHDEPELADAAKWGLLPVVGSPRACHTFYNYTKDWPTEYEDYFSMGSDGKRIRAINPSGPGQVCLSNPQTRKLFADRLRKYIQMDRKASTDNRPMIYVIEMNDNNNKCVCPACLALEKKYGAYSGAMLEFINAIADDVSTDYPDVKVQSSAYMFTEKPPQGIVPRPNVLVRLAQLGSEFGEGSCDTMRPLTHPNNQKSLSQLRGWSALGKLAIWDYWILYGGAGNEAAIDIAAISSNLRLYKENHVESVFVECESPDTTNFHSLRLWLGYQLMRDPSQDAKLLVDKFMAAYYGTSAPFMRRLLDYVGTRMEEIKERLNDVPVAKRSYLDNDFFKMAEELLASAEKAANGDTGILHRIAKERVPLDMARLKRTGSLSRDLLPSRQMVVSRLQKNWPEVVNDFYPRSKQAELVRNINDYINGLNVSVPLPAEFKDRDVVDIIWTSFKPLEWNGAQIVDDCDAAGGRAMKLGKPKNAGDPNDFHSPGLEMGLYSASSKRELTTKKISKAELPHDEKFHFYSLGKVTLEPKCYVRVHKSWIIQQKLWDFYESNGISNEYEIYLSLKAQGPSYVSGSQKEDAILMDRVLLVRPPKGH